MASSSALTKFFHRVERFFQNGADSKDKKVVKPVDDYENQPLVSLEAASDPLASIVFDVKNMVSYAKQRCKSPPANYLTIDQSAAIILYTMQWSSSDQSLFKLLNQTLREGNRDELKPWLLYLKLFTSALARLPSVSRTVYRGIKDHLPYDYREGERIIWESFSSCTQTMNAIEHGQFLGSTGPRTLFIIDCISGKSIHEHSAYPNEEEVILTPHRQFQVISNMKKESLTIVQLKEIESVPSTPKRARLGPMTNEASNRYYFSTSTPPAVSFSKGTWEQNALTIAGGKGDGSELDQLNRPHGLFLDKKSQTVFIADGWNHRIVAWKIGTNDVRMIIGRHGGGRRLNQLCYPTDILIDESDYSLIISDRGNHRVLRWPFNPDTFHADQQGEILVSNIICQGLAIDETGNLYVSDTEKHHVKRYRLGESHGVVVAGGHGEGEGDHQLNQPSYLFVTADRSIFVSDEVNDRVMKWEKGSKKGLLVAGGRGRGARLDQLWFPRGLWVNDKGTVFVADSLNHRIVSWNDGEEQGQIVVGGRGGGHRSNQLLGPQCICFDQHGDLYVVDRGNARVQKYFLN